MMARKYMPPKCDFSIVDGHIETDGSIKGKVTGTMMGGIIRLSPWSTPFQVACRLLGLAEEDISDKPAVKTGQVLESKVLGYAAERYGEKYGMFIPADEIHEKREGDHASWESDFDDEYFAGHVDGYVMNDEGVSHILEIKTSSNLDAWTEGVPSYYYWQVALYNEFITKQDHAYVVLGIVDDKIRRDPSKWVPSDSNVMMFKMSIEREGVGRILDKVREWYDKYIAKGITPDYDPTNPGDVEMFEHLVNISADGESITSQVDELHELDLQIKEAENSYKDLVDRRDELRDKLKDYMISHDMDVMTSLSGEYIAVITESSRSKIDPVKLKEAGIDPAPYTTVSVSKSFTIKKNKE